jgi:hypothetical protein
VVISQAPTIAKSILPFLSKLLDYLPRREVEVNLGGGEPIMTQMPPPRWLRDAFLDRLDREGVAQLPSDRSNKAFKGSKSMQAY